MKNTVDHPEMQEPMEFGGHEVSAKSDFERFQKTLHAIQQRIGLDVAFWQAQEA